jgi:hypothetical protein
MLRFRVVPALALFVSAVAACSSAPEYERIEGEPNGPDPVTARTVIADADVSAIGVGGGALVAGVGDGLVRSKLLGDDTLVPVPVVAASGEPPRVGSTALVARRGNDGWLVWSEHGLFLDGAEGVSVSPFTSFLAPKKVRSIDVTGAGPNEALWFVSDAGAWVRSGTTVTSLAQEDAAIEALVGIDDHRALAWSNGELAEIDVTAGTRTHVVSGVPRIAAFDRGDDGTIWLATDEGLFARSPAGTLTQRTLAAAGAPPRAVRAVSAGVDRVVALAGGDAIAIVDDRAQVLVGGRESATRVAVDANGDVWIASPRKLERLALGKPSSFATDVAPFMTQHCKSCHADGSKGAPKRAFDDYDTARAAAFEISARLRAAARPVMPPADTERLAPADYRVVLRWIAGGMPR